MGASSLMRFPWRKPSAPHWSCSFGEFRPPARGLPGSSLTAVPLPRTPRTSAVGRSGPEFEAETARLNEYLLREFTRVAVLVRSVVGEMQAQRLVDRKARMVVLRDVDAALDFLASTAD